MRVVLMLTVMFTLACGDDNSSKPTAPTPTPEPDPATKLIGTWRYTGNDYDTKLAANLKEYFVGQGLTASEADTVVSEFLMDGNEPFFLSFDFKADDTVIVDNEETYRFEVSGNRITFTTSDGVTLILDYAVTDTTLTLLLPVAPLLAAVGLEAEDEAEAELQRIMLQGIEVMTMFFSR